MQVQPRFRTQFRNGTWQVFDTIYYGAVQAHRLEKHARESAEKLNIRHAAKGGRRA